MRYPEQHRLTKELKPLWDNAGKLNTNVTLGEAFEWMLSINALTSKSNIFINDSCRSVSGYWQADWYKKSKDKVVVNLGSTYYGTVCLTIE